MGKSLIGKFLYFFERSVCSNLKRFIGRHEKTFEIGFLIAFVLLQTVLAYFASSRIVTLIIIIFLFLLSLERIIVHIWLEFERDAIKNTSTTLEEAYKESTQFLREENIKIRTELKLKNRS